MLYAKGGPLTMAHQSLQPVDNRILVKREAEPDRLGGIYIPQSVKGLGRTGKVLAVGGGEVFGIKIGDTVAFEDFVGHGLPWDDTLLVLRADDVLGIMKHESTGIR